MAALIRPDTIGIANNHFLEEGMLDSEAWGRPRNRDQYPGHRGFANYIFDLYYTYLSAGLRIPASAGSANGVLKNPIGYSRSYAFLGNSFTTEAWLAAQKAGRNFVTNGPMLFLNANGERPGAVLPGGDQDNQGRLSGDVAKSAGKGRTDREREGRRIIRPFKGQVAGKG